MSSCSTAKFLVCNHTIQGLKDARGIAYIHAGLYQKAHKIFKNVPKQTIERSDSAMYKNIRKTDSRTLDRELVTKSSSHLSLNCTI